MRRPHLRFEPRGITRVTGHEFMVMFDRKLMIPVLIDANLYHDDIKRWLEEKYWREDEEKVQEKKAKVRGVSKVS